MEILGDVTHEFAGGAYSLRFSYAALDAIEREFGEDWSARIQDLFTGKTKRDLEFVTALVSGESVDDIRSASPPIVPLVNALFKAWQLAWHGFEPAPEVEEQSGKKPHLFERLLMRP